MSSNLSWKTAFLVASMRLIEQYQPKETQLFHDPVIKYFFSKIILFQMKFKFIRDMEILFSELMTKGAFGALICRTKYIDDLLKTAMTNGIDQIVILGAGLDTRPYRIPGIDKMKVIEVDLPIMQNIKKEKIQKFLGAIPPHVTFTSIDFNHQTLDEVLNVQQLDFSKPIFFIWEGVTPYISKEGVVSTLEFISKASSGSVVVFSYILKSIIDQTSDIPGADNVLNYFESKSHPWIFGLDPLGLTDFLTPFHLTLVEDIGASYYQENYLKPLNRNLAVSKIERIAYAKRI
ncbi:class I SAM-dependent methyltransferase [Pelosinus fermentans]|uniref:S-adenosyl-L-methionine-dependent methyltransferase n=1 Tax=Pelosinus fermentans JBW45 TaxID=1192197 RepID=I9DK14_9FIRM|nr:class I SAM-dependent methyltransferase [Pelosinus fermentans]AJQ28468.1 methyltransferase [Pelosinus fermentans JBW45]